VILCRKSRSTAYCFQLVGEAVRAEEWNTGGLAVDGPGLPGHPDVKVQQPGRVGQGCNSVALNRNGMLGKLPIEGVAEHDDVRGSFSSSRLHALFAIEPELHLVKKVETTPIDNEMFLELVFSSEEDCGGKDSLKGNFHSPVLRAVFAQPEVIEELRGAVKMESRALLLQGEGCQPDGNEPVLTVGDGRFIMHLQQ